jgi:hypothetical protein
MLNDTTALDMTQPNTLSTPDPALSQNPLMLGVRHGLEPLRRQVLRIGARLWGERPLIAWETRRGMDIPGRPVEARSVASGRSGGPFIPKQDGRDGIREDRHRRETATGIGSPSASSSHRSADRSQGTPDNLSAQDPAALREPDPTAARRPGGTELRMGHSRVEDTDIVLDTALLASGLGGVWVLSHLADAALHTRLKTDPRHRDGVAAGGVRPVTSGAPGMNHPPTGGLDPNGRAEGTGSERGPATTARLSRETRPRR